MGYPAAAAESDKTVLAGVLDRTLLHLPSSFLRVPWDAQRIGGKPKGDGLDQAGQLKALKADLWKPGPHSSQRCFSKRGTAGFSKS